jgi:hypothetical protein
MWTDYLENIGFSTSHKLFFICLNLIFLIFDIFKSLLQKKKDCKINWTPCPESASELYWPSDRHLWTKLVLTLADRGCDFVSMTDPYCRNLGFLDRSCYFFFQVAPQLYSRVWVDPAPDPVLRKPGSTGNRTRTPGSLSRHWSLDHRGAFYNDMWSEFLATERRCIVSCEVRTEFILV